MILRLRRLYLPASSLMVDYTLQGLPRGRIMIDLMQKTFVTMFDGSPEKALRAVLIVMGVYVLTAAPLVTWVVYGLFQKDPNVSIAVYVLDFADSYLSCYSNWPVPCRPNSSLSLNLRRYPNKQQQMLTKCYDSSKAADLSSPKTSLASLLTGTSFFQQ